MLMPSIFGGNLFDELVNNDWFEGHRNNVSTSIKGIMKTDIVEKDNSYELTIELPGYDKKDIQAEVNEGYLTITATRETQNDETDEFGKVIRKERYSGSCKRTYFVGEAVKDEDISAKFENGELKMVIPKKEEKKEEVAKGVSIL